MKKTLLILASAAVVFAACNKVEPVGPAQGGEMSVIPLNSNASLSTKGYVEKSNFLETYYNAIHESSKEGKQALRTMQISSYLHPQNGAEKNYFVDKTYSPKTSDLSETEWWNTNTVGGNHDPIYWPVGGTLDFLAYSVSAEQTGAGKSQNVTAAWDETNAASKVVLTIPGENSQNDILFAGAAGIESSTGSNAVPMKFSHAQAWLEFKLTGSVDDANPNGIVTLKRIELEDVYNAGTLTVSNNRGNTFAKWDFSEEIKQDIEVDNFNTNNKLNATAKYLDMLIPQQTKTAFVIYYTLGNSPKELSYRFTTDQKTWLMGEKYIYNINITTSEVTVTPTVNPWSGPVQGFEYTVNYKSNYDSMGTVTVSDIFGGKDNGEGTITCDTWGAQVTLEAEPKDGCVFLWWSDGVTENPRTFTITESVELPEAVFAKMATITITPTEFGKTFVNGVEISDLTSLTVMPGTEVNLKATKGSESSIYVFNRWEYKNAEAAEATKAFDADFTITVTEDITCAPYFKCSVDYVEIEAKYDGTNTSTLKWATQNLAITESGNKTWKKFTYANDREIFHNGDYFQWAAHVGYCGEGTAADKGLLIYDSFTSTACGDTEDKFTFKSAGEGKLYRFNNYDDGANIGKTPYHDGSAYTKYQLNGDYTDDKTTLDSSDDVASIILNEEPDDKWRMPKSAEFKALTDATVWVWDATDGGYYVFAKEVETSKKYNALLFFPAAGYGRNSSFNKLGSAGYYWSSFRYPSGNNFSLGLGFSGSNVNPQDGDNRFNGYSVRPVSD